MSKYASVGSGLLLAEDGSYTHVPSLHWKMHDKWETWSIRISVHKTIDSFQTLRRHYSSIRDHWLTRSAARYSTRIWDGSRLHIPRVNRIFNPQGQRFPPHHPLTEPAQSRSPSPSSLSSNPSKPLPTLQNRAQQHRPKDRASGPAPVPSTSS